MEFEKWRAICASVGDVDGVGGVGVKGSIFVWMACERGWYSWRANVSGMLLLLILLLSKYYPEEKNVECLLLKQKSKTVPNRSGQLFERRT